VFRKGVMFPWGGEAGRSVGGMVRVPYLHLLLGGWWYNTCNHMLKEHTH
jgi:hypothetical protein